MALGANSPFLFGKELWRETRIPLFEQATDTRPAGAKEQGVRPRVWFGERWITSVFDQFEENVRYFPALLPVCDDEDPVAVLDRGDVPQLAELRMHNGTIYRWNRPVYDVVRGRPHLRVENRVLPAGPTVVDVFANGAFYYGLLRALAEPGPAGVVADVLRAPPRRTSTQAPGTASTPSCTGPGRGEVPATELVLRRLLPMAHAGPGRLGHRHRGQRPAARRHRAALHRRTATARSGRPRRSTGSTSSGSRWTAATRCGEMLRRYSEHMHANEPVADWPWRMRPLSSSRLTGQSC